MLILRYMPGVLGGRSAALFDVPTYRAAPASAKAIAAESRSLRSASMVSVGRWVTHELQHSICPKGATHTSPGCNPGDGTVGMHPGHGRWVWMRSEGAQHSICPKGATHTCPGCNPGGKMVDMHPGHGWWVCIGTRMVVKDALGRSAASFGRRIVRVRVTVRVRVGDATICGVPLQSGNVRGLIPRALPWAGMRCPVGAGIGRGHHHPAPGNPSTSFIVSTLTLRLQAR